MTTSLFSSELLKRLRRSMLVTSVLFVGLTAAACGGDDDDDDDGTGPSADCLDEFSALLAANDFDEDDVDGIELGDSQSGSLSTSDPEDEFGYFSDVYALDLEESGDISITLNPSGFDAVLLLFAEGDTEPTISDDDEDPDATEELAGGADAGCYLIVVTSFEAEETGSYTLAIDEI